MSNLELEQQLLSLDLGERIRILQLLAQSLTVPKHFHISKQLTLKSARQIGILQYFLPSKLKV